MSATHQPRAVLITGATGGLGQSLARRLIRDRAFDTVVLGVRDGRRGAALRDALRAEFPDARFAVSVMDVGSLASVGSAVDRLEDPLDAVVLNAGGTGGAQPLKLTADGVTQIVASNIVGHASLVGQLIDAGLLTGTVEFVGSEAAFGVPALRIPTPDIADGSTELFSSWIDGSWFTARRVDRGLAYGQAKLLGALWIGAQARRHGDLRLLTMSPGNTVGTGVNRDLPAPVRVLAPRVMALLGRSHSLADGTERLAAGLLDLAYGDGRFWASANGRLTGPVVDQATVNPVIGDPEVQDHACEAIERYVPSSGGALAARST
jgi:NAD(P)-dependent dehydrogenase (short-subunit alcohol dehydrogenase family)